MGEEENVFRVCRCIGYRGEPKDESYDRKRYI